jgi:acetolactate synthase-1/2/3 large subunit
VDALRIHDVDTVFCVPGESYLAVLDALHDARDTIRTITCRQEGGAANMAEAYGKLTGQPGICFVTRGPGATNASIGVHTAFQDSTPMILFIGQVVRDHLSREAFQEVDLRQMFAPLCKWVAQIEDPAQISEMVSDAFARAVSGRPGPVALALPEDVLREHCESDDAPRQETPPRIPDPATLSRLLEMLAGARRPLLLVGGGGWSAEACADIVAFGAANSLPLAVSFRCQDYVDNTHPNYAGDAGLGIDPALAERIRDADLLIAVGPRLGEVTTSGYTLLDVPKPRQTLIHVHPSAEELGRVYHADLSIHADMPAIAAALRQSHPVDSSAWAQSAAEAHAEYLKALECPAQPGALDMGEVMKWLRERLPEDAIITNGAGNFSLWPNKFYSFRRYRSMLAPTSGAMGYGVPAAVAAKVVHPERTVVCFTGDGDFLMNGQELATAVQYGLAPIILLVNNGMYGTIRMHQERHYPGRVSATDLVNPDFTAYARAFGAYGERVERTEGFAPAFERALVSGRAALIELQVDAEGITPRTTLNDLRRKAQRNLQTT